MCVVAWAWRGGRDLAEPDGTPAPELVVFGNRDEFHHRPAAPLAALEVGAPVLGGVDLEHRGGWLWASASGRLATVTNVRVGGPPATQRELRSRGELVQDFAAGSMSAPAFVDGLRDSADQYGRFNLMVWDGQALAHASNAPQYAAQRLAPGIHAVSNGALDAPWPKTTRVRQALERWLTSIAAAGGELEPLFEALRDERPAPDHELPDTGVGLELERQLAPPFVRSASYGTRCSSVVVFSRSELTFAERRYDALGARTGDTVITVPRK
ncbi:MAG: NRDE family protein [Kofleriaceae bacterium]